MAEADVGYVRPELVHRLLETAGDVLTLSSTGSLVFQNEPLTVAQRSEALHAMHLRLSGLAIVPMPATEYVDVRTSLRAPVLFQANRSLIFPLGIKGRGVHLVLKYPNGDYLIGQRSLKVFTSRGCFDVPVGGVLPRGKEPWEQALIEAHEEAGLTPASLFNISAPQCLNYACNIQGSIVDGQYRPAYPVETDGGTNWDEVYFWCAQVADDFEPTPLDGEVRHFHRMSPAALLHSLTTEPDRWKTNSGVMLLLTLRADPHIGGAMDIEGFHELQIPGQ